MNQRQVVFFFPVSNKQDHYNISTCVVCGAYRKPSNRYVRVKVCVSCREFFRRALRREKKNPNKVNKPCYYQNNCEINENTRRDCRSCRYRKCLEMGMRSNPKPQTSPQPNTNSCIVNVTKKNDSEIIQTPSANCVQINNAGETMKTEIIQSPSTDFGGINRVGETVKTGVEDIVNSIQPSVVNKKDTVEELLQNCEPIPLNHFDLQMFDCDELIDNLECDIPTMLANEFENPKEFIERFDTIISRL